MLHLTLEETALDFQKMIDSWREAFECKFPRVVFTDVDESIHATISSVSYSESILHFTCTFHLLYLNVKKRAQSLISEVNTLRG